ncbi:hypothetical protein C0991_005540 [Blastosporella zonata]|nr:hypothetical protein C0991_005540 [Blastosporella zonata]
MVTLATWILDLIVNVGVTSLIVYRLYSVGYSVNGSQVLVSMINEKKTRYMSSILIVVESGLIMASAIIVMVGMFVAKEPATVAAIDVVAQVATLTPLLIIVRVGFRTVTQDEPVTRSYPSNKTSSMVSRSMLDKSLGVQIAPSVELELSPAVPKAKDSSYA